MPASSSRPCSSLFSSSPSPPPATTGISSRGPSAPMASWRTCSRSRSRPHRQHSRRRRPMRRARSPSVPSLRLLQSAPPACGASLAVLLPQTRHWRARCCLGCPRRCPVRWRRSSGSRRSWTTTRPSSTASTASLPRRTSRAVRTPTPHIHRDGTWPCPFHCCLSPRRLLCARSDAPHPSLRRARGCLPPHTGHVAIRQAPARRGSTSQYLRRSRARLLGDAGGDRLRPTILMPTILKPRVRSRVRTRERGRRRWRGRRRASHGSGQGHFPRGAGGGFGVLCLCDPRHDPCGGRRAGCGHVRRCRRSGLGRA